MPTEIHRETLHEILRSMLKDTLVPVAQECFRARLDAIKRVCETGRAIQKVALSDAVILACVRHSANAWDVSRTPIPNGYTDIIFSSGKLYLDGDNVKGIGAVVIEPDKLCAEVRAALLGESDE